MWQPDWRLLPGRYVWYAGSITLEHNSENETRAGQFEFCPRFFTILRSEAPVGVENQRKWKNLAWQRRHRHGTMKKRLGIHSNTPCLLERPRTTFSRWTVDDREKGGSLWRAVNGRPLFVALLVGPLYPRWRLAWRLYSWKQEA